eukprot:m.49718 g.49718  ORF g.49718 m.49718 type:complete len:128 (-) comp11115_c0_seq3:573-956(-)
MLNTLKGTLKKLKQKEAKQPVPLTEPVEDDGDEELVIETKDQSLTGVIGDMGYSGTAIGGCGSAWTRSFNMQAQPTAEKAARMSMATPSPPPQEQVEVARQNSIDSLDLDVSLFVSALDHCSLGSFL